MKGKRLFVAEKPSVGRTIATYLGACEKHDGWLEGPSDIVTWVRGHVVDLVEPDGYEDQPWGRPWRLEALPMVPDRFMWHVSEEDGADGLYRTVTRLMDRADVSVIVHACDDDREGEGIFRRVLRVHPTDKPVLRLWQHSLEDAALASALASMRPDTDYDGLGDAAAGRAVADWLVGMNLTRACTKTYSRMVHAGRVTSPTLHLVCERTRANADFTRMPFWQLEATLLCGLVLRGERLGTEAAGNIVLKDCEGGRARVTKVERHHRHAHAPALFDLTGLQREAARRYGLTAKQTLDAAQALYEAKLMTYPRTDSTYVTSDMADEVRRLVSSAGVRGIVGESCVAALAGCSVDVSRVICDERVNGHPALLPTSLATHERMAGLPADQASVLRLVCVRLLVALAEDSEVDTATVEAVLGGHDLAGRVACETHAGWRAVERAALGREERTRTDGEDEEADVLLPAGLVEGSEQIISALRLQTGETKPPKPYTDDTLLAAMQRADRLIDDKALAMAMRDSSSHSGGLGAPSSRADVIEELVRREYVRREGKGKAKILIATDEGFGVDACVPASLKSVELTATWEEKLGDIEHGRATLESFVGYAKGFTRQLVREVADTKDPSLVLTGSRSYGACPRCGAPVVRAKSGRLYYCSSRKGHHDDEKGWVVDDEGCGFRIFPDQTTDREGKKRKDPYRLSESQVEALLAGKEVKAGANRRVLDKEWGVSIAQAPSARGSSRGTRGGR